MWQVVRAVRRCTKGRGWSVFFIYHQDMSPRLVNAGVVPTIGQSMAALVCSLLCYRLATTLDEAVQMVGFAETDQWLLSEQWLLAASPQPAEQSAESVQFGAALPLLSDQAATESAAAELAPPKLVLCHATHLQASAAYSSQCSAYVCELYGSNATPSNELATQIPLSIAALLYQLYQLAPNGVLLALLPTADLLYAQPHWLYQLLLDHTQIIALIGGTPYQPYCIGKTPTHLLLLRKQANELNRNQNLVKWVQLYNNSTPPPPLDAAAIAHLCWQSRVAAQTPHYQLCCLSQFMLRLSTDSWWQHWAAPPIYRELLRRGRNKFSHLANLATLQQGYDTRCDDFFVLHDLTEQWLLHEQNLLLAHHLPLVVQNPPAHTTTTLQQLVQQHQLRVVRNGYAQAHYWLIEQACLQPIHTPAALANTYIMLLNGVSNKQQLHSRYPYAAQYVEWGEKNGVQRQPAIAAQQAKAWYCLAVPTNSPTPHAYLSPHGQQPPLVQTARLPLASSQCVAMHLHHAQLLPAISQYMHTSIAWLMWQVIQLQQLALSAAQHPSSHAINQYWISTHLPPEQRYPLPLPPIDATLDPANPPPQRLTYDHEMLRLMGILNSKERQQLLNELYLSIANHYQQQQQLAAAQPTTDQTTQQLQQLQQQLNEQQISTEPSSTFAHKLRRIIEQQHPQQSAAQQQRLLRSYWRQLFGKAYPFGSKLPQQNTLFE